MRWKDKPFIPRLPVVGETRVVSRFLWWPKWLDFETRWLERADIVQRFVEGNYHLGEEPHWRSIGWN